MILIFIVSVLVFGDCVGGSAGTGAYKDEKDYIDYSNRDGDTYRYEDKKYDQGYQVGYQGYNKYQVGYKGVKFDKYDGPRDYLISDIYRDSDKNYGDRYDGNYGRLGSDLSEYDYVPKCNVNENDCKEGRDCYDKAIVQSEYDKCRESYGNEGRYYDDSDRYTGTRYRYNDRDQYFYEKECNDNYKDRADYEKCLDRYYNDRNRYYKDCYDNNSNRNDYNRCRQYYRRCREYYRDVYRYSYNEQDWKNNRDCYDDQADLVGLGRNNREDQLIRPCAVDDRQCIRKYLARNSKCKPAYGPIPDPLYLRRSTIYYTFANITVIRTRLRVTGLSSIQISEFYVNKDTGNLVMALDFQKLNLTSPRAYFRYKRTAKESIVLSDYMTTEYKSGTFTAVLPRIPHLRLDLAEIHADIDDIIPANFIGPMAYNSTDLDVVTGYARLNSDIPTATQESFLFQAQLLTAIYIQENICDFGLKLISI